MIKKLIASIILISCLLFCSGYFIFYLLRKAEVKNEMKLYLKNNPSNQFLQTFYFTTNNNSITNSDFVWDELDEEFYYKGILYDVATIKYVANSVVIDCIADKAEQDLKKLLTSITTKEKNNKNTSTLLFLKIVQAQYLLTNGYTINIPITIVQNSFGCIEPLILQRAIAVLDKPPL